MGGRERRRARGPLVEGPHPLAVCVQVEMVFAKADPRVSLLYEEYLVAKELVPFGDNLRR